MHEHLSFFLLDTTRHDTTHGRWHFVSKKKTFPHLIAGIVGLIVTEKIQKKKISMAQYMLGAPHLGLTDGPHAMGKARVWNLGEGPVDAWKLVRLPREENGAVGALGDGSMWFVPGQPCSLTNPEEPLALYLWGFHGGMTPHACFSGWAPRELLDAGKMTFARVRLSGEVKGNGVHMCARTITVLDVLSTAASQALFEEGAGRVTYMSPVAPLEPIAVCAYNACGELASPDKDTPAVVLPHLSVWMENLKLTKLEHEPEAAAAIWQAASH